MALTFLTNVAALEAQTFTRRTQNALEASIARLASGRRIARPSDDPAGLAIGSRLQAALGGLQQAQRNTTQSMSLVQTADASLGDIGDLLRRMQELATQASGGGSLQAGDFAALNSEFGALQTEVSRIAQATSYNGQQLIDGSLAAGVSFQVGPEAGAANQIGFAVGDASANVLGVDSGQIDVRSASDAQNALSTLSSAIDKVAVLRTQVGATDTRLRAAQSNLSSRYTALSAAHAAIVDTDVAWETTRLTGNALLLQAGLAVLAQANLQPATLLSLLHRPL